MVKMYKVSFNNTKSVMWSLSDYLDGLFSISGLGLQYCYEFIYLVHKAITSGDYTALNYKVETKDTIYVSSENLQKLSVQCIDEEIVIFDDYGSIEVDTSDLELGKSFHIARTKSLLRNSGTDEVSVAYSGVVYIFSSDDAIKIKDGVVYNFENCTSIVDLEILGEKPMLFSLDCIGTVKVHNIKALDYLSLATIDLLCTSVLYLSKPRNLSSPIFQPLQKNYDGDLLELQRLYSPMNNAQYITEDYKNFAKDVHKLYNILLFDYDKFSIQLSVFSEPSMVLAFSRYIDDSLDFNSVTTYVFITKETYAFLKRMVETDDMGEYI